MSEFSKNFMKWCGKNSDYFIETGTFKGVTTKMASQYFDDITSIEINEENHNFSKEKLKDLSSIELLLGDTVELFPSVLEKKKDKKTTFWLDAHPMDPEVDKSCPLLVELDMIKEHSNRNDHIILIDDLQRCFQGDGDYPTHDELKEKLLKINPDYKVTSLPFKSWKIKKGEPTVLCASVDDFNFSNSFYINKLSFMNKYLRRVGLKSD